jgi:uncharacterized repeat protein (TIGR03803 family)
MLFCVAMAISSPAQTLTTLASFNFSNGDWPAAPLIQGADGNFYGTTEVGGNLGTFGFCYLTGALGGCGTVFKVTSAGVITSLYLFCAETNCTDGALPSAPLVQGPDGNFYGTTVEGGANDTNCPNAGCGTVFKITPSGTLTTLYSFCSLSGCTDGYAPHGGLILGSDGNFYGTAASGGGFTYSGTIFKITPNGILTTLHSFTGQDGEDPQAGLVQAADGSLYGTTENGGTYNAGTVFKITPSGAFTTLYSFGSGTDDGSLPESALIQATDGNLYGATSAGGQMNWGTVFKITPGGALTTLYSFCSQMNCPDGFNPQGLVQATDGNLYGTTAGGGTIVNGCISGCGTIFKITTAGQLTTLHAFDFTDGEAPFAALLQATDGKFYGTTLVGGSTGGPPQCTQGCGTVFSFSLGLAPFVVTQPTIGQVGTPVTILGTNLTGATSVTFNGTPATIITNTGSAITTTVPTGATTGTVQVGVGGNNLVSNSDFQVVGPIQFVPVTPCRLIDTRQQGQHPIQGGTSENFIIPQLGGCSIPTSAAAYSLNVTVVPITTLGYLTIWPEGEIQPLVSTMNSPDGRIKANAAIVPSGNNAVSVYVTDTTNVILDIDGYFTAPGSQTLQYYPLAPCRVVDTRQTNFPQGLGAPPFGNMETRILPVSSSPCFQNLHDLPFAYSFNVTVVPHPAGQPLGYLTIWPSDFEQPLVSTLNNPTATVVANAAIVPPSKDLLMDIGSVSVFTYNSTDLIIDVNGYFDEPGSGGSSLYPVSPCRVLDTRNVGNGQPFMGEITVNVVGSACAPPSSAQGYVFNATVVPPGSMPYLTLWADGSPQPTVSTLNAYDGFITSNMAIVPTTNGSIDAWAQGLTQLILDISGYFAP